MIAGLSESAIRRQISDGPSLVFATPPTNQQAGVNLRQELDTMAADDLQAGHVAELTSTGTNTMSDVLVQMEDQATETGSWL